MAGKAPGRALKQSKIKGVQRLADFQHDIIGDVHHVVHAAQSGFFQEAAHPVRAGADFDAAHQAGGVAGTKFRLLNAHADKFVRSASALICEGGI